jgi:hypothetical protein
MVFHGESKYIAAGIALGPKHPHPGTGRPNGIGFGGALLQFGDAYSLDAGLMYGLDLSAFFGAGISTVTGSKVVDCTECDNGQ